MCRSIRKLRGQAVISDEEIAAAARQYIRKISGYQKPSRTNEAAFEAAVDAVAKTTRALLEEVPSPKVDTNSSAEQGP